MGLVQIEESELAAVRTERDTAKSDLNEKATALTEAERKIETLEAEKATAEEATKAEKKRADDLEAEKAKSGLKADRLSKLGSAFKAKIESLPSVKAKIEEQAGTMSEEDWTARLTEIEELAGVKPDAKLDGDTSTQENANNGDAPVFKPEEVASVALGGGGGGGGVKAPTEVERGSVVGKLADAFGGSTNGNKA